MNCNIDLKTLILNLRPDLREKLGFARAENEDAFLAWLVTNGVKEYKSLHDDPWFLSSLQAPVNRRDHGLTQLQYLVWLARPDVQSIFSLPDQKVAFFQWFYTHGLEEHGYWPLLSKQEKQYVLNLPEPWRSRIQTAILQKLEPAESRIPFAQRPFGVNVVGYAFGQLGIGEDARMAARSLLAAKVPMTIVNFPPGSDVSQNDQSMVAHVSEDGQFAFNIFCMTAEENGRYYAERGRSQFLDRYNIGYWPWELSRWPAKWEMLLDLVDEVWVSTQHTYNALAPVCSKPLHVMPMAVELGSIRHFTSRKQARKHFSLPERAKLFCFSFDLKSSIDRKNPQACVDAFLDAFPKENFSSETVGLVIKIHKPTKPNRTWKQLKRLAAVDKRIHIIENTLPRPDLLALYKACDCFTSLHRAEGFGRGLAEALQLGLHVIATGYSGNVDFCQSPYADLVNYRLIKLKKRQYPHSEGQVWADPDINHAAELMRRFVLTKRANRRHHAWPEFSAVAVGQRYKTRLETIYNEQIRTLTDR
jgi:glycosyltransferase involved in cell wall biosynthesis